MDGYNPDTHTIYEFYGCYLHGCRTCQPQRTETHALRGTHQCYPLVPSIRQRRRNSLQRLHELVCKYGKYPVGHPTILSEPNTTDLCPYFGLAKCIILFFLIAMNQNSPFRSVVLASTKISPQPVIIPTTMCSHRYLVHSRIGRGRLSRVHHHQRPRNLAFSCITDRALC